MTAQLHEVVIIEGDTLSMAFVPPLPDNHPRVVAETDERMEALRARNRLLFSTACWRGYQGTWRIDDGKLYLASLEGRYRLLGGEPLFADWVTCVLRVPRGNRLHYVHMGFGSIYEMEIHVKIERGIVVASRTRDNRGRSHDPHQVAIRSMPGGENDFPGDDEL
jgi:hypothetical protein